MVTSCDSGRFARDAQNAAQDPPNYRGMVFEHGLDGQDKVLRFSGQTSPDGTDIPVDAVSNDRVFIYVDGIHTSQPGESADIQGLFLSPDRTRCNIEQPAIGIQEGVGKDIVADGVRITKDFEILKGLQSGLNVDVLRKAVYDVDPAVKSVHDEIRQSLDAGRNVQVALHSGGGAETAVALTLLAKEDGGRFAPAIRQHVRVLAMAPAAAPEDFTRAGVQPGNLLYTGSHQDPVYHLFHNFVQPGHQGPFLKDALQALELGLQPGNIDFHNPYYIFDHNLGTDGTSDIQRYLDGAPGSVHTI
ncbi:MAG TPA: hypothetical protein VGO93_12845 [Candidatus Xenobia bacterium]|jgi:hypothetical protein